ncbi:MAG: ABC transporter ATP-binding protein [Oscillatoriales cyanobacterium SM2_2_1]|nr:ABC transporter ATP-binding protein [Oscillatoriales cyanobacterium SM2_2_1]
MVVAGKSHGHFDPKVAEGLLHYVGLGGQAHVKVRNYSTGMKQRLGIAAALLSDPPIVILDEPTNGMDPAGIREMRTFIRSLADDRGKTIFYSSHLLAEIQQTCDRVAIIHFGNIIREGTVEELVRQQPEIDIEVSSVEAAEKALQGEWKVKRAEEHNVIRVEAEKEQTPQIIQKLAAHNVSIIEVKQRRMSLEEFFLGVTGHMPTDGGAPPPYPYPQGGQPPYPYPQQPLIRKEDSRLSTGRTAALSLSISSATAKGGESAVVNLFQAEWKKVSGNRWLAGCAIWIFSHLWIF